MADLPTPLVTEILSKLPVKSIIRFQCVSKSWNSIINDPHFIKLHLKHSLDNTTNHTLIMRYSYLYSVDFPTLDCAIVIDHPLKSCHYGTELLGSCNGLLCLSNGEDEGEDGTILYNPATRRYQELPVSSIEFPDSALMCERMVYGFGYDQVNDDYKVIRIIQFDGDDYDFHDSEMKVYSLKNKCWKRVRDFPREYYLTYKRASGVYVNGCLHWVVTRKPESDGSDLIMAVDLGSQECEAVPQQKYAGSGEFQINIGVLQGCLFVMCNYFEVRTDVWVMDEYGVEESWSKKFSVAQPKVMGCFDYVRPIAYSKDGTKVLLEQDLKNLVWFDLQTSRAKRVNVRGMPDSGEVAMLVESLIPLDNLKKNRQKREKKSKKKRDDLDGFLSKGFNLKL